MPPIDDFRKMRWAKLLNRSVQIVLSLTLALGLNYLAATHFSRKDLTQSNQYSLSPETMAYIADIVGEPDSPPVNIYVTLPRDSDQQGIQEVVRDIERLLREFEYASRKDGKPHIIIEAVDIFQQRAKAQELREKFNVNDITTAMVISQGDRFRPIPVKDLYEWKNNEATAFLGERVVASALLGVTSKKAEKVYFVLGHGEMKPDDINPNDGISEAVNALRQRNLIPEPLTLFNGAVPDDAALVVIVGPQKPFLPQEIEALRRYLEDRNGRVLVFLDPRQEHGLDQLFYEWGLYSDDRLILDLAQGALSGGGDVVFATFADHPITRSLAENDLPTLFGPTRPMRRDVGGPLDERLVVRELILSSPQSWGEADFRDADGERSKRFDPTRDIQGPLSVAALAERSAGAQLGISLQGGRLLAVGSTGMISNQRFHVLGNEWLFLNMVNWMLNQDTRLNVAPRPVSTFSLAITKDDYARIGFYFAILPTAVALMGILVFWVRRR